MTYLELEAIVARIKYKPNVRFGIDPGEGNGLPGIFTRPEDCSEPAFMIAFRVPDARPGAGDRLQTVFHPHRLPPPNQLRNADDVLMLVHIFLRKAELHELDEWLELDGKRPFYPHAPIVPNPDWPKGAPK